MRYTPKPLNTWERFFAILPRRMYDGQIVWLEYLWRKNTALRHNDRPLWVYSYEDKTAIEAAYEAERQHQRDTYKQLNENYINVVHGSKGTRLPTNASAVATTILTSAAPPVPASPAFDPIRRGDVSGIMPFVVGAAAGYAVADSMGSGSSDSGSASSDSCSFE